jgi:hypothetical protein
MAQRRIERRWGGGGWAPVAGAAAVAVALTLIATARYGPGAEPDSVTYLAAARHLRAGHGFADIDGTPLTLFPPVFPAAVAALEWLGLGPLPAARFLNAACFGLLVVLAAVWARRITGSPAVGTAVAVVVALAAPMVAMASTALSEPIGVVLVVACLLLLTEALGTDERGTGGPAGPARGGGSRIVMAAGLAAGLACLTRYASVVLFPVGAGVLLARPGRWAGRARATALFLVAGLLPFGAWLARNVAAAGNATGDGRGTSALSLLTSLKLTLAAVGAWVLPGRTSDSARAVAGAVLCLAVVGALGAMARGDRRAGGNVGDPASSMGGPGWQALPAAAFVVAGVAGVAWFEATMAIDPPPRFLLPVFVPLVVGAAVVVAEGARRWSWRPALCTGLAVAVVALSLPRLGAFLVEADSKGLLEYSRPAWVSSPLLAWLKTHPVRGAVASDDPYVLDLRLGIPADLTPARTYYASDKPTGELPGFLRRAARAAAGGGLSVVWFPRAYLPYLYSLSDLQRVMCLQEERHFADGDLLRSCPTT